MLQRLAVCLAFTSLLVAGVPAEAQFLNRLLGTPGATPGTAGRGPLGGLGGAVPSVNQASPGNIAGLMQYCVRKNYVSGTEASSVKNAIVGKVGGYAQATSDNSYRVGSGGVLDTGNGKKLYLGSGGMQAQVTHKVCDLVLTRAKSML